jgi:BirA family biotin operon repressor/biotin-[acetyl-CoA-carboxylase] ligase
MKEKILSCLSPAYPWKEHFHFFPTIDSTNDRLRAMARAAAPEGTVLVAGHQTGGHGRRGLSFHSPEGMGIYMSILLRPQCAPTDLMHLTCATAVAMCDAVEKSAGFRPGIKWTNDLVFEKRKLGGILTELGFTPQGTLDYAIIGIGINCCQQLSDFPEDIREIAGSLSMTAEQPVDQARVAAAMMDALYQMSLHLLDRKEDILNRYRSDCITLDKDVMLVRGDQTRYGHAIDIDEEGALVVRFANGSTESVNSGEISVRGMYGYVS